MNSVKSGDPFDTAQDHTVVAVTTVDEMRDRIRRKSKLKGRQVDEIALAGGPRIGRRRASPA